MKKMNWKILFSIGVFIALIVSCFGGSVAMAFSGMQNSSDHDMPCCTEQYTVNLGMHMYDFVLTSNPFEKILFSLVFSIFLSFIFSSLKNDNFYLYLKRVRSRFGDFSFFNYFSRLFKIGILHPKTW
ncbi:MAG: hypothetical protein L3J07_01800 [Candidatus Magasanikbacteria bacterium]|nr:hypothetical protein [Candidatus Magasanikbacteria bacterium]